MEALVLELNAKRSGFTLVELLLAMGITGVILAGIIALTSGTLRYTGQANAVNELTTELNDALGYIGLKLRSASQLVGEGDFINITSGGASFECSISSSDGPCLAAVVPVVDRASASAAITSYEVLAYRIAGLDEWADNPGLSGGWDGATTPVLLEYRSPLSCSGACSTPPLAPSSTVANRVSFITSGIFLEDDAGNAYEPFEINSTTRATLRLRIRENTQLGFRTIPANEPLELRITRRQ